MPEYAFEANVKIAIRVDAPTERDARVLLYLHLDCADSNFGAWPDGNPIVGEASLWDRPRVYEIDKESYEPGHGSDEDCIRRAEDDGAVFRQDDKTGLWSASNNDKQWKIIDVATLAGAARLYSTVRKKEIRKVRRSQKRAQEELQSRMTRRGWWIKYR